MIVTIQFNLPDEQFEFDCASKGSRYRDALVALAEDFRAHRKYDKDPVTEETFYAILDDCDVTVE
jgi:hypothetical protein